MGVSVTTSLLTAWHAAAVILFLLIIRGAILRKRRGPMPPGPVGWPIIGNALDIPLNHSWKTFAKWGERWGDLMSVVLLGQPMVIINSYKHAYELLEKRSAIYSDRPHMIMAGDIVGWDQILVLLRYGNQFREYRRLMARVLGSRKSVEEFVPIIEEQTGKLLARLLREPASDLPSQIRKMTGSIVLMISYGYEPQENDDPLIRMADEATEQAAEVAQPGAFFVDVFPFLKYVPSWMPGAGWKRKGERYRANMDQMSAVPHQFVKDKMGAGTALPSFTSTMLAGNPAPDEEYRIKMSAASIYSGGADTTVSAELTFILAMSLWPAVQKKAQEELDAAVGHDRLPTYADIVQLPYLNAIYLETLRWNQVVPLGVPHAILEDDVYEGYFIPKGSIVCINQWNILHDPEIYADPFTFNPERFLPGHGKEPELDPRKVAFGFGRRICPGIHLAESSVLMVAAMLLSVFNIKNPLNEHGIPITPQTAEHTGGTISHPAPFTCTIEPRSDKAKALILALQECS
ncbi:cytochrome P450 [Dichomitus squalens]|uniref:Cytochrome P450 n=1 Tax=Dichomitus squalens TaxID=114155 RepID=A0A4Q9MC58_9APHY|nr:cytochrome P450 [Dichomitus squalens]